MKTFLTTMMAIVALTQLLTVDAWAKRSGPAPVAPVVHEGVKYIVPNHNGTEGCVEAWDVASGGKLWSQVVYKVTIKPELEADVQWVFITKLEFKDGKLIVTNERQERYSLDPKTREVKKLAAEKG
jgi:hypothetical protein